MTDTHNGTTSSPEAAAGESGKRSYEAPVLISYGAVGELTSQSADLRNCRNRAVRSCGNVGLSP